jgi:hypothetical protein
MPNPLICYDIHNVMSFYLECKEKRKRFNLDLIPLIWYGLRLYSFITINLNSKHLSISEKKLANKIKF